MLVVWYLHGASTSKIDVHDVGVDWLAEVIETNTAAACVWAWRGVAYLFFPLKNTWP
jgi:hypothetical protein